jgi:hypothetical protein
MQGHGTPDENARPGLQGSRVGFVMELVSFRGEAVFRPDLLYMNQGKAAFAE